MTAPDRITIDEVKQKIDAGEPIVFIDTRNSRDWNASDVKIPGVLRIHYSDTHTFKRATPRRSYCYLLYVTR